MPSTLLSDGCSWFPELWINQCCVAHDLGSGDIAFMNCIIEKSSRLGPLAFIFAGLVVSGMAIGRPLYHFVRKLRSRTGDK